MRGLIIHADDLGLTPGVNAGLLQAHRHGVVRSASLMVTTPGFDDAVALARQHPTLDLGIHLNLTTGRPCLPPVAVPSLVDGAGRFLPLDRWLVRAARGQVSPDEVQAELSAQMERALATGLPFSHLDGHHHIHLFRPATAAVATLARRHGVAAVRISDEAPLLHASPTLARLLRVRWLSTAWRRRWMLTLASDRARPLLGDFAHADYFVGLPLIGAGLDAGHLLTLIQALPTGTTELMCHPGYGDGLLATLDPGAAAREREVALLCNPALLSAIRAADIDLLTMRDPRATPVSPA